MSQFFEDLFNSIFTPGPTSTLIVATNASFGALQLVLLLLLIGTKSIHFLILSFLCGGLWAAINWFARELQATKDLEERQRQGQAQSKADDSGTETEDAREESTVIKSSTLEIQEGLTKRRSLGESGTDSEWDKVESEVDVSAEE